jgi:hypothetical protein
MEAGGAGIIVYVVYVAVALALTAWLARTLFRSGTAFLHDVFADKPALADAVNRPRWPMPSTGCSWSVSTC